MLRADPVDLDVLSALTKPGSVTFSSNRPFVTALAQAGGRYVRKPSGHLVFFDHDQRRILATDPEGNPLHECEWEQTKERKAKLNRARFRLDWGQWVGLKPEGLINTTTLDLSRKPGWQQSRADDLRQMAAQAMHVPLEEVRFFYGDEDLVIDARGQANIRHKKDALYVLDDGTFDRARFMACMGAMHWASIDFLPVVELFQSLLPGTGSAAFELIRGLYDDQNEGRREPLRLRYRGIPTYPSEAAFRLFSSFFNPQAPGGRDPFRVFMDQSQSYQVAWLPAPDPPLRFFDRSRLFCVTVKGRVMQRITLSDDPIGLSYTNVERSRFAPCERSLRVEGDKLVLTDRSHVTTMPLSPYWGPLIETKRQRLPPSLLDWRSLFGNGLPQISPVEAFAAVLLYPEDDAEIGEMATQPFVADYVQDCIEQDPHLVSIMARSNRVLISHFDAVINTCIGHDHARDYTVLWKHGAYAQKQAQVLWNRFAGAQCLEWLTRVRMSPSAAATWVVPSLPYDVIYAWMSFASFDQPAQLNETVRALEKLTAGGGLGFLVGPPALAESLRRCHFHITRQEFVETLPTFRMHQSIIPKARIKPGLTLYLVRKD